MGKRVHRDVSDIRHLRPLEKKTGRLKRLAADRILDSHMLLRRSEKILRTHIAGNRPMTDGGPFQVLTVISQWNHWSSLLEVDVRMSGETIGQALDRALTRGPGLQPIMADHGRNFRQRHSKIGRIIAACGSTSFDRANSRRTPLSNPSNGDCKTSV